MINNYKINKYINKKNNISNINKIDYYNKKIKLYGGSSFEDTDSSILCNSFYEYDYYKKKFNNFNRYNINYYYDIFMKNIKYETLILNNNEINICFKDNNNNYALKYLIKDGLEIIYTNIKYVFILNELNIINIFTYNSSSKILQKVIDNIDDINDNIYINDNIINIFNFYEGYILLYKNGNIFIKNIKSNNKYNLLNQTINEIGIFKIFSNDISLSILLNNNELIFKDIDHELHDYKFKNDKKLIDLYHILGLFDNGNIELINFNDNKQEEIINQNINDINILNNISEIFYINEFFILLLEDGSIKIINLYHDQHDIFLQNKIIYILLPYEKFLNYGRTFYLILFDNRKISIIVYDNHHNMISYCDDIDNVVNMYVKMHTFILLLNTGEIKCSISLNEPEIIINELLLLNSLNIVDIKINLDISKEFTILLNNGNLYDLYDKKTDNLKKIDFSTYDNLIHLNINNKFVTISNGLLINDDKIINENTISFLNYEYYSNLTVSLYHTDITDFDNITIFDCQQLYDLTRITKIYKHKDNYIIFYNNVYYYLYNKNKLFHKIFYNEKHNLFATLHLNNTIHLWSETHSNIITEKIITISQIYNNKNSFAILFKSGLVKIYKANSNNKFEFILQINNISYICNNSNSFALLTRDGQIKIFTNQLIELPHRDIIYIFYNEFAYAFLSKIGTVNVWGNALFGGSFNNDFQELNNVEYIYNNDKSFAALLKDRSVKVWGNHNIGGFISLETNEKLKDIHYIYSNKYSYAALLHSGEVVSWGNISKGGLVENLIDVNYIFSNDSSYIAIKNDKTIYAWGDVESISESLKVLYIFNNDDSYAILSIDGTIHSYGKNRYNNTNSFYFSPKYDKYIDKICEKYNIDDIYTITEMTNILSNNYYISKINNSDMYRYINNKKIYVPYNIINLLSYYEIMKVNPYNQELFIESVEDIETLNNSTDEDVTNQILGLTKSFFDIQCGKLISDHLEKINKNEYIFKLKDVISDELIYLGFIIGRLIIRGFNLPFKFHCTIIHQIINYKINAEKCYLESILLIKQKLKLDIVYKISMYTKIKSLNKNLSQERKKKDILTDDIEEIIEKIEINKLTDNDKKFFKLIDYIQDYELTESNIEKNIFIHENNNIAEYLFITGLFEVFDKFEHFNDFNINSFYNKFNT